MKNKTLSKEIVTVEEIEDLPDLRDNLMDIAPTALAKRIAKNTDLVDKTPAELMEIFKAENVKLTETIETLRDAFWLEYDRAVHSGRKMLMENIYHDICLERTFRSIYTHPLKLAYIITPIIKYDARLNSLLRANSINILKEILDAPMYNDDGSINDKVARLKLSALKQLEDRTQGTPIQKSEIKQLSVNIDNGATAKSVEDIQKRIAEIDAELNKKSIQEATTKSIIEFRKAELKAIMEDEEE